jgi:hypothetical protein
MACQAAEAERMIRKTGELIGQVLVLDRPINVAGAKIIRDCVFKMGPKARRLFDAQRRRMAKAHLKREAERARLRELGVAFVSDLPEQS